MPIYIGNNKIRNLYYDNERIGKIYVDNELVFVGLKFPRYTTIDFHPDIDISGLQAILGTSELTLCAATNSVELAQSGFGFVTKLKVVNNELVYTIYGNDLPDTLTEEVVYTSTGWKSGFNHLRILYGFDTNNSDLYKWFVKNATIVLSSEPDYENPEDNTIYRITKLIFNDTLDLQGLYNIGSGSFENVVYYPELIYFNMPAVSNGISQSLGIMKSGSNYSLYYATTDFNGLKVYENNSFINDDYKTIIIQNDVTLPDALFKWLLDNSNLGAYITLPANTIITFNGVLNFDGFKEGSSLLVSLPYNYYYSLFKAETNTGGPPEVPLTAIAYIEHRDNPSAPKQFGYQSSTQGQWYILYNDNDYWGPYSEWRSIKLLSPWTISNQFYQWLVRNADIN